MFGRESEDSRIKNSNRETTDLDNAAHRIGQVNTYVLQEHPNVNISKEGDIMKNCAGHCKESNTSTEQAHHQKKTTEKIPSTRKDN